MESLFCTICVVLWCNLKTICCLHSTNIAHNELPKRFSCTHLPITLHGYHFTKSLSACISIWITFGRRKENKKRQREQKEWNIFCWAYQLNWWWARRLAPLIEVFFLLFYCAITMSKVGSCYIVLRLLLFKKFKKYLEIFILMEKILWVKTRL